MTLELDSIPYYQCGMDTKQEHSESQERNIDLAKAVLGNEEVAFMTTTMIREGFIQDKDETNLSLIRSRWELRLKTKQVSAKDLKMRGGE